MDGLFTTLSILILLNILACGFWWWVALSWMAGSRKIPDLVSLPEPANEDLPVLSVIIPARDEADSLGPALSSVLQSVPPNAEVILVNDRSSDNTAELALEMARKDARVTVLTVADLPAGWLGKNHAIQLGADASSGEWMLFTDADVHFENGCIERALNFVLCEGLDHLVVAPELRTRGFFEKVFVSFFVVILLTWLRGWRVNDPASESYLGIGAFNLVRREAYLRAGEHHALRDEVVDDLVLGRNLRRTGSLQRVVGGRGCLWVRWNEGLGGLIKGVEKNAYAGFGYNPFRAAGGCIALLTATLVPFWTPILHAAFGWPWTGWAGMAGLAAWPAFGLIYRQAGRHTDVPWLFFPTFPLGAILQVGAIIRSAAVYHISGGVRWKGTLYEDHGKGL
ncbi:MAG: glycosyltransferase [Deltaproteobacteria bacterium]|nr:glycosyltransferase [Deltaproteobacteria bacterium]